MSLSYDIKVEQAHVKVVGTGKVTMPAMIDIIERVAKMPRELRNKVGAFIDFAYGNGEEEVDLSC